MMRPPAELGGLGVHSALMGKFVDWSRLVAVKVKKHSPDLCIMQRNGAGFSHRLRPFALIRRTCHFFSLAAPQRLKNMLHKILYQLIPTTYFISKICSAILFATPAEDPSVRSWLIITAWILLFRFGAWSEQSGNLRSLFLQISHLIEENLANQIFIKRYQTVWTRRTECRTHPYTKRHRTQPAHLIPVKCNPFRSIMKLDFTILSDKAVKCGKYSTLFKRSRIVTAPSF